MRLDADCVRDVLLCVEENTGLRKAAVFTDTGLADQTAAFLGNEVSVKDYQLELEKSYPCDKLIYHLNYCAEAGLVKLGDFTAGDTIWVEDLTPAGHEFLSNIRESSNWEKTMDIAGKAGTTAISMLTKIAEGVALALAKQHLGLL